MTSHTITIAPNDGSGATTTVVVDTVGGQARVTDVHLHAKEGLTNGRLPDINFDLLIAAFNPAAPAMSVGATPAPIDVKPADVTDEPSSAAPAAQPLEPAAELAEPVESDEPAASPQPASGARRGRSGRARAPKATGGAAPARPRRAKSTPAATSTGATPSVSVESRGGRAYRRMPDDLATVYGDAKSVKKVAEHYGVPRHTAQGWVRRLTRPAQ